MDWLHEVRDDLEKQVFDQVANLLNLEVDLLFFDTTSTYFELEGSGAPSGARCCPTGSRRLRGWIRPGFAPTASPRNPATISRRS
nr:hypothetical protein [Sphaerisporangium perillae]